MFSLVQQALQRGGISKKHPRGEEVFEVFNKGLNALKDEGIVKQAYQQAGFFNVRVAEWNKLN